MRTNELVERILDDTRPVRPLRGPAARTWMWMAVALPYLALVVWLMEPRPDLAERLGEFRFNLEQGLAVASAVLAALAAFSTVVPGFGRWPLRAAALAIAAWIVTLSGGCLVDLWEQGVAALNLVPDFVCLPSIALAGAFPAIAIVVMLRRGAPLTPFRSTALAGFAAAAFGGFGLRFFHAQDAGLMVIVWQFGSVIVLTAALAAFGGRLLAWRRPDALGLGPASAKN